MLWLEPWLDQPIYIYLIAGRAGQVGRLLAADPSEPLSRLRLLYCHQLDSGPRCSSAGRHFVLRTPGIQAGRKIVASISLPRLPGGPRAFRAPSSVPGGSSRRDLGRAGIRCPCPTRLCCWCVAALAFSSPAAAVHSSEPPPAQVALLALAPAAWAQLLAPCTHTDNRGTLGCTLTGSQNTLLLSQSGLVNPVDPWCGCNFGYACARADWPACLQVGACAAGLSGMHAAPLRRA